MPTTHSTVAMHENCAPCALAVRNFHIYYIFSIKLLINQAECVHNSDTNMLNALSIQLEFVWLAGWLAVALQNQKHIENEHFTSKLYQWGRYIYNCQWCDGVMKQKQTVSLGNGVNVIFIDYRANGPVATWCSFVLVDFFCCCCCCSFSRTTTNIETRNFD